MLPTRVSWPDKRRPRSSAGFAAGDGRSVARGADRGRSKASLGAPRGGGCGGFQAGLILAAALMAASSHPSFRRCALPPAAPRRPACEEGATPAQR